MSLVREDLAQLAALQIDAQRLIAKAETDSVFDALVVVNECLAIATALAMIEVEMAERAERKANALAIVRRGMAILEREEPPA